jgi:DNA-binding IclR family transcriptional regulator
MRGIRAREWLSNRPKRECLLTFQFEVLYLECRSIEETMALPTSPAVATALTILEQLSASPELGVSELARRLQTGKSSVYRLLNTLASKGYVDKNPDTDRYRLTYRLFLLSSQAAGRYGVKEVATPVMQALAQQVEEAVNLGILEQDRVVNLLKIEGPHHVRLHLDAPGGVFAHATALGKSLLAALGPEETRRRLPGPKLTCLTPRTLPTLAALNRELVRVRERGYAVDDEECSAGIRGVAAVVRDRHGDALAAISIAGPTFRMTDKRIRELAPLLAGATAEVSRRLGWEQVSENRRPGGSRPAREAKTQC